MSEIKLEKKAAQAELDKKVIVLKFGGTSVKTPSAIKNVVEIVKFNSTEYSVKFIVVSAIGGVTNMLVDFCNANVENRKEIADQILQIHVDVANGLGLCITPSITKILKNVLLLDSMLLTSQLNEQQKDFLISLGERLSCFIIHCYMRSVGMSTVHYLDARKMIFTDNLHGKANPNTSSIKIAIAERMKDFSYTEDQHYNCLIDAGDDYAFFYSDLDGVSLDSHDADIAKRIFITNGFIGSTPDGVVTTLGRGGSDYTAALIAEAVQADELFIYTDVAGVYTMDPNLVSNAKLIEAISFQEMAEMANFGAKVLHPATLEPCIRSKIPVRILSTFEYRKFGTFIVPGESINNVSLYDTLDKAPKITALTMRKSQILVTIKSLKMLNVYGFLANIFNILANYKISVDLITTSEISVALTIDNTSIGSHGVNPFLYDGDLLNKLSAFAEITVETGLTLIGVVGRNLVSSKVMQKIMYFLEKYRVRLICYGASSSIISFLVPHQFDKEITQNLHEELIINSCIN